MSGRESSKIFGHICTCTCCLEQQAVASSWQTFNRMNIQMVLTPAYSFPALLQMLLTHFTFPFYLLLFVLKIHTVASHLCSLDRITRLSSEKNSNFIIILIDVISSAKIDKLFGIFLQRYRRKHRRYVRVERCKDNNSFKLSLESETIRSNEEVHSTPCVCGFCPWTESQGR